MTDTATSTAAPPGAAPPNEPTLAFHVSSAALAQALKTQRAGLKPGKDDAPGKLVELSYSSIAAGLILRSSDRLSFRCARVPSVDESAGSVFASWLLDPRPLLAAVAALGPELRIEFDLAARKLALRGSDGGSATLAPAPEHVLLPRAPQAAHGHAVYSLPIGALREALGFVLPAAVGASSRGGAHYTNYVLLQPLSGPDSGVDFVATDGLELRCFRACAGQPFSGAPLMLDARFVERLLPLLRTADPDAELSFVVNPAVPDPNNPEVIAQLNGETVCAETTDVRFPDYRRVIPAEPQLVCYADRWELRRALKAALAFAGVKDCNPVADLRIDSRGLSVSASAGDGGEIESAPLPVEGVADWQIRLNPQMLGALLNAFSGLQVTLRQAELTPISPLLLCSARNPQAVAVLMPIRVD